MRTRYCVVSYASNQTEAGWHFHTSSLRKVNIWERRPLLTFVDSHNCQRKGQEHKIPKKGNVPI